MKNKILPILCIFILISFIFTNNIVNASDLTLPSIDSLISSNDNWFVFRSASTNDYYLIVTDSTNITYTSHYGFDLKYDESLYYIHTSGGTYVIYYILSNGGWELLQEYNTNDIYLSFGISIPDYICASNFDLCNDIDVLGNSYVVFRNTPTLSTLMGMNSQQVVGVFQTMMSGIIPYLIALVIGLVAFWKAWQLLLKELRKA